MTEDVLAQLGSASPRRVLDDLARVGGALAKADRPRPDVELFLASGPTVKGRIVAITDDRNAPLAVLHVGGTAQEPAVAFVRVDHIVAIGVTDASVLVRAPISDAPAPSRLELQRQIAARLDALQTQLGKTEWARPLKIELAANLDDDERRAVGALVPVLFEVLGAIVQDDMGRAAIGAVDLVELAAGAEGEVVKEARGFLIRAPKLLTAQLTHQALRRAIEKHL